MFCFFNYSRSFITLFFHLADTINWFFSSFVSCPMLGLIRNGTRNSIFKKYNLLWIRLSYFLYYLINEKYLQFIKTLSFVFNQRLIYTSWLPLDPHSPLLGSSWKFRNDFFLDWLRASLILPFQFQLTQLTKIDLKM